MRLIQYIRPLLVAVAATALAAPSAASQSQPGQPDVMGVWVMDPTKFQKNDSVLVALKLTVSREGDTLRVVSDVIDKRGQELSSSTSTARYALDGTPTQNSIAGGRAVVTSRLAWEGAILVLSSSGDVNGRPIKTTERWRIDGAGTTMSRQYVAVINGREIAQTLVFTRR